MIDLNKIKTKEQMESEELNIKISDIDNDAMRKITSVYPIYKQLNILASGIGEDIVAMRDYINKIRSEAKQKKAILRNSNKANIL